MDDERPNGDAEGDGESTDASRRDDRTDAWSASETSSSDISVTPSIIFGLLAEKRERLLLYLLYERGGTLPLDELTTHIAAWENETTPELLTQETKSRIKSSLHHSSIPRLVDHDLATYDADERAITLTEEGEHLEPYLEFAKEQEPDNVQQFLEQSSPP